MTVLTMTEHIPKIIVLDDAQGQFGPLTDLRSIFQVRSGTMSMLARLEARLGRPVDALAVTVRGPEQLAHSYCQLIQEQTRRPVNPWPGGTPSNKKDTCNQKDTWSDIQDDSYLIVNGRWLATCCVDQVLSLTAGQVLVQSCETQTAPTSKSMVAAHVDHDTAIAWLNRLVQHTADKTANPQTDDATSSHTMPLPAGTVTHLKQTALIHRPWHLLEQLPRTLLFDLERSPLPLLNTPSLDHVTVTGDFDIRIASSATISPMVHLDATDGPIVIDEQARIGAFSLLTGPCYVGQASQIVSHTCLRPNTVIGNHCVIGGEVGHSLIQGRTSKCHAGYLGNALVGMWVNMGADTNASNLKNTYNSVNVQLEAKGLGENTHMQKVGPLIGDFVRTAIGSRLTTGACIGTGSMLALSSISPKHVPRFRFVTDGQQSAYDIDKFIDTAHIMHQRRQVCFTQALQQHLRLLAQLA